MGKHRRKPTLLDWIDRGPDYRGLRAFFQELSDKLREKAWEKDPLGDPFLKAVSLNYWDISRTGTDRMLYEEALSLVRVRPAYLDERDIQRLGRLLDL